VIVQLSEFKGLHFGAGLFLCTGFGSGKSWLNGRMIKLNIMSISNMVAS